MDRLKGKVALITGGTSGIGFAAAKIFLAEGARVAITGHDADRLQKAHETLGQKCLPILADAGDLSSIDRTLDAVQTSFGTPDVLFLNAGIARYSTLESATEAAFDEMFALHVKGPFFTIQKAAPRMAAGSSIIITTSVNDRIGMKLTHVYASTKAAARQLVRTLAGELGPRNIRVNALSPGPVITDIGRTTGMNAQEGQQIADYVMGKVPLSRFAEAHELGSAALFLASDESSFVNGTELLVDGGWADVGQ
ncbi:MAG: SDR family oxidoreductase [Caulobacterales bacterium]